MTLDLLALWGKTDKKPNRYHPLLCHMLDVAAVAQAVWGNVLPSGMRDRLARALSLPEDDARRYIALWAGLHDSGKASPAFQKQYPEPLLGSGLQFSGNDQSRPHGFISAHVLRETLGSSSTSTLLAQIAGGHHGAFPRAAELVMGRDTLGSNAWREARHALLREFANIVGFDLNELAQSSSEITDPAIVPVLAGFISVVDWIGSDQNFFPCAAECGAHPGKSTAEYWTDAKEQAQKALEKLGWLPAVSFAREERFDAVFSGFTPNGVQDTVIGIVSEQISPYMMIVEAPMGHGKTEAALFGADTALCRGFARGIYIAMPTQATSNAMFKRVLDDYLKKRGHQGKLNLQLVHGDALLAQSAEVKEGEIAEFKPEMIGGGPENAGDEPKSGAASGDLEARSWFTAKKRPLLAPFGVGTIDQSLLGVLQTRHWFVRLFGLAGKVVIFDEVHAYDAYMSTILERLLRWLAEVDCTVILLSATLPEGRRRALARAYSGRDDGEYKCYPRVTLARPRHHPDARADSPPECTKIPMEEPRSVDLRFAETDLQALNGILSEQLEHGGCAAVICDTVDRSIEMFKHLRDELTDTECLLFHARTLQMWRREREEEVLRKFGKGEKQADGTYANPNRPHRAVLVATQVIEQSLDLDFDLMVSEIAPVDLLLQRCGRLHRHPRMRPAGLEKPRLIVLCDGDTAGSPPPSFGKGIEYVYDRYVLLRTWLALRDRQQITVPAEIEAIVEAVYGPEREATDGGWSSALLEARTNLEVATDDSIGHARHLIVREPDEPAELIERFNRKLDDDDDPATDKKVRAATREGTPGIRTVFLVEGEKSPKTLGGDQVRWLLDRSASISQEWLFDRLLSLKVPPAWQGDAHLRHCRLIEVGKTKGINVQIHKDLGVEFR